MTTLDTDPAGRVINRIERADRYFRFSLFAAVAFESALIVAFVLAADFKDREQLLLLIAFGGILTMGALGFMALATYLQRATLRVLQAVETLRK
jgi:hypothetical protein